MQQLWEATRDLHHACEEHPVGNALASGKPPRQWYADWLGCLSMIHDITDTQIKPVIHRAEKIKKDIQNMDVVPRNNEQCQHFCSQLLENNDLREGAIYVLTGAHLMGGEIMRRRLDGFPVSHLEWDDRQAALEELRLYRNRPELTNAARECFGALLKMMDEIVNLDSQ